MFLESQEPKTDWWNVASDFLKKLLYLVLDYFEKNKAKNYQKQQFYSSLFLLTRLDL